MSLGDGVLKGHVFTTSLQQILKKFLEQFFQHHLGLFVTDLDNLKFGLWEPSSLFHSSVGDSDVPSILRTTVLLDDRGLMPNLINHSQP